MNVKKLTENEFFISTAVSKKIDEDAEMYNFHLLFFKSLGLNPLLKWTYDTLKNYKLLYKSLHLESKEHKFTVNAYYHLLQLASEYEDEKIHWNMALEIAQDMIKELFNKYELNRINICQI